MTLFAGAPVAAAAATGAPAGSCLGLNLTPSAANAASVDAATLCLIDRVRAAHRIRALRFSRALQAVAAGQAADMVRGHYFRDHSLSGQTPLRRILSSHYRARAARAG